MPKAKPRRVVRPARSLRRRDASAAVVFKLDGAIEQAIGRFEITRCAQAKAVELASVAEEWLRTAEAHRASANAIEEYASSTKRTRARLLKTLQEATAVFVGAIEGHSIERRRLYVASLPDPLGAYIAQMHLSEFGKCPVSDAESDGEVAAAHRACGLRFRQAAERIYRLIPTDLALLLRNSRRGAGGRLPDVAVRWLVERATTLKVGYKALASALSKRRVPLELGGEAREWHERNGVGVACPAVTHEVHWDHRIPGSPRPIVRARSADGVKLFEAALGQRLQMPPDEKELRERWAERLKKAVRVVREGGKNRR